MAKNKTIDKILAEAYDERWPQLLLILKTDIFEEEVYICIHRDNPVLLLDPVPERKFVFYLSGEVNNQKTIFIDLGELYKMAMNNDPLLIAIADEQNIVHQIASARYECEEAVITNLKNTLTIDLNNNINDSDLLDDTKYKLSKELMILIAKQDRSIKRTEALSYIKNNILKIRRICYNDDIS